MNELSDNTATKRYIGLSTVTVGDFYTQLCDELGVEAKGGKSRRFNAIQDQILYLYKEKKKPLVLVIDEAQYLNQSISQYPAHQTHAWSQHCPIRVAMERLYHNKKY